MKGDSRAPLNDLHPAYTIVVVADRQRISELIKRFVKGRGMSGIAVAADSSHV